MTDTANDAQREYWNDRAAAWVPVQDKIDRLFAPVVEAVHAFAQPAPGERVLEIGCGAGSSALALRERVGANGAVVGVDIAAAMIAAARERAAGTDIRFIEADAASHPFESAFDLVFSRFGVMFFADPVAAFTNIRCALAPGGRLAFVCWRGFEANGWAALPMVTARPLLPPQDPVDPHAPGPFAFADGDRLRGILAAAGWRDIRLEPSDNLVTMGANPEEAADTSLEVGPLSRIASELDAPTRAAVHAHIVDAMRPHMTAGGVVLPTAVWLVAAG